MKVKKSELSKTELMKIRKNFQAMLKAAGFDARSIRTMLHQVDGALGRPA